MGTTIVNGVEIGPDGKEWAKTEAGYAHVNSVTGKAVPPHMVGVGMVWHGYIVRDAFVAGAEWQERRKPDAEAMWDRFIAHLNATQPLTKDELPHKTFCGSIAAYRKVFIEAQHKEDTK